jgi:hypothetical protein
LRERDLEIYTDLNMSSDSSATTLQGHFIIDNGDDEMDVVPTKELVVATRCLVNEAPTKEWESPTQKKVVPEEVPKEVPKVVPKETEEVQKENTRINKRRPEQEKNEDLPEETGWLTKEKINKRRLGGATVTPAPWGLPEAAAVGAPQPLPCSVE